MLKKFGDTSIHVLFLSFCLQLSLSTSLTWADEKEGEEPKTAEKQNRTDVIPEGKQPADSRLKTLRNLRDKYHPWTPPQTKEKWEKEADQIRTRLLVSNGLWPMPPKAPLKPVIHGQIDQGDYTVEKVYFASHPGFYVTGNLYRPKNINGTVPGVLCPHGHWQNGRFYEAKPEVVKQQLDKKAEKTEAGARSPIQARLVQLARMGCVVFHYDMVGNADSKQLAHSQGFRDVKTGLYLNNAMGVQTFNSICALDFLMSFPNVDKNRIGVTGSSGGGTQTFMVCALDPRPAVAFPAVMVSTAMQGGCVCENADYLRVGINNVAIAGLFAPKPMAMSGANDWTIDIETKGLPELKQIYSLYGQADLVHAKAYPQFGHNYNNVAREMMYDWFNKYLDLGQESPVEEQDFQPLSSSQLTVFDSKHTLPDDAKTPDELRAYLQKVAQDQYAALLADDVSLKEYKKVVGPAARILLDKGVPQRGELDAENEIVHFQDDLLMMRGTIGRTGFSEQIPFFGLIPPDFIGNVVFWVDPAGKSHLLDENGQPKEAVKEILATGKAVASADVFMTGEYLPDGKPIKQQEINSDYSGYTFGYNRPLLSNRVRDILTILSGLENQGAIIQVDLVGTGEAGLWVLLARSLAGSFVDKTIVETNGFDFAKVESTSDPNYLPGALRYGGLPGLAALAAPRKLTLFGVTNQYDAAWKPLKKAYKDKVDRLILDSKKLTEEKLVKALSTD